MMRQTYKNGTGVVKLVVLVGQWSIAIFQIAFGCCEGSSLERSS